MHASTPPLRRGSKTERSRSAQQSRQKTVVPSRSRSFEPRSHSTTHVESEQSHPRPQECVGGSNLYGTILGPTVDEQILAGLQALFNMCGECRQKEKEELPQEELPQEERPPEEPEASEASELPLEERPPGEPEAPEASKREVFSEPSHRSTRESVYSKPSEQIGSAMKDEITVEAGGSYDAQSGFEDNVSSRSARKEESTDSTTVTVLSNESQTEEETKSESISEESQTSSEQSCQCKPSTHDCECGSLRICYPPDDICSPPDSLNQSDSQGSDEVEIFSTVPTHPETSSRKSTESGPSHHGSHHEPSRHEPSQHEPSHHEPSHHEPSHHGSLHHEPPHHGSSHPGSSSHHEPPPHGSSHPGSSHHEPPHHGSSHSGSPHHGSSHPGSSHHEPSHPGSSHHVPPHHGSSHHETSHHKPSHHEPSHHGSSAHGASHHKPSHHEPSHHGSSHHEPSHHGSLHLEHSHHGSHHGSRHESSHHEPSHHGSSHSLHGSLKHEPSHGSLIKKSSSHHDHKLKDDTETCPCCECIKCKALTDPSSSSSSGSTKKVTLSIDKHIKNGHESKASESKEKCGCCPGKRNNKHENTKSDISTSTVPTEKSSKSSTASDTRESSTSYTCISSKNINIGKDCACQPDIINCPRESATTSTSSLCLSKAKSAIKKTDCCSKCQKNKPTPKKVALCKCDTSDNLDQSESGDGSHGEVRYAITKITRFANYTTYEVMKSTGKKPKVMPTRVEGVFVLKNRSFK